MTKPMIRIHNSETDEVIDREMNEEEYATHLENVAIYEAAEAAKAKAEADKATLLARLGITAEEAKTLLS